MTLFLLVISLVLLSWLNYKNPVIYDWTASGRNTLSSTSIDLLEKMPEKIDVISYARNTPFLRSSIKKFIAKYQKYKPNISLSFVDPDTSPDEARNLGITVNGEILVRYKGRTEHLITDNEQVLNAVSIPQRNLFKPTNEIIKHVTVQCHVNNKTEIR